jgi:hypothetical protein
MPCSHAGGMIAWIVTSRLVTIHSPARIEAGHYCRRGPLRFSMFRRWSSQQIISVTACVCYMFRETT